MGYFIGWICPNCNNRWPQASICWHHTYILWMINGPFVQIPLAYLPSGDIVRLEHLKNLFKKSRAYFQAKPCKKRFWRSFTVVSVLLINCANIVSLQGVKTGQIPAQIWIICSVCWPFSQQQQLIYPSMCVLSYISHYSIDLWPLPP